MKIADAKASGIISTSRKRIKKTKAYHERVWHIKADIGSKYEQIISKEGNYLKKILLRIKMRLEIAKEIHELTSYGKLYSNQYP